jgi:Xaa-Pro aminopeptidase
MRHYTLELLAICLTPQVHHSTSAGSRQEAAMTEDRKRQHPVRVMFSTRELAEMRQAADQAGIAMSVLIRAIALAAVRRGELVINDAARAA